MRQVVSIYILHEKTNTFPERLTFWGDLTSVITLIFYPLKIPLNPAKIQGKTPTF